MRRRVIFITRKWPPAIGGMETYCARLSTELARLASLETVVLPGKTDGNPPGMWQLLRFLVMSAGRLSRRRADVVHIGDLVLWPLAWVARMAGSAPRVVMTAYGLDLVYGRRRGLLPWIYRLYLRAGVRLTGKTARVIAISGATAALCKEVGFSDVVVVTLGVDVPVEEGEPAPTDAPFLLFVGRLVPRKGAAWFARNVMPSLPAGMRLVVVGKCWDRGELDALRALTNMEYRGVVSDGDLLDLRRGALAVVMPNTPSGGTDMEGFGLAAVEAAAAGGVLLASGIEGIVDAVIDGVTGFLLPACDADRWVTQIEAIASWSPDARTAFVREAREAVAAHFSWHAVAERTMRAYGMGP